jgi:hypothetical protein
MPQSSSDEDGIVIGDGVITIPSNGDRETMDIPSSVGALLISETAGNIQNTNLSGRNIANIAMGSLQAGVARTHNEMGTEESRAISGVMATPIAPPSTGGSGN